MPNEDGGDPRDDLADFVYAGLSGWTPSVQVLLSTGSSFLADQLWQSVDNGYKSGSRVRFEPHGRVATFHRPHPEEEARPYQVRDARAFLESAGIGS